MSLAPLAAACGGDDDARLLSNREQPAPGPPPPTTMGGSTPATATSDALDTAAPDVSATELTTPTPSIDTTASTGAASTSTTSTSTTSTTTTTIDPLLVAHAYPVDPAVNTSWTPEGHSTYQATDIFASTDCGTALRSPVDGVVDEVLPDVYDRAVDDPATRGGNAVSIIGDDGVRYYLAHFQLVDPAIAAGARVAAGQHLGEMGTTGRSGACHLHFGLSLPCPDNPGAWWVRRGVVWPDQYLTSWKDGGNLSPLPELQEWFATYPDACNSVEDIPYAHG
jgi:murein DD-endopeptidase MepM/ murein hydrolase activator NlpD